MAILQSISVDLDGDGQLEQVVGTDTRETIVVKGGAAVWSKQGSIDGWNRRTSDRFLIAADVDGDGGREILIASGDAEYTGVMKWQANALHVPWAIHGSIDGWHRRAGDVFPPAAIGDLDGDGSEEILIVSEDAQFTGAIKVSGGAIHVPWTTANGWIDGWNRQPNDALMSVGSLEANGRDCILVTNEADLWTGVLVLANNGLHVPWASPSPLSGSGGQWQRSQFDSFSRSSIGSQPAVRVEVGGAGGAHALLVWSTGKLVVVETTQPQGGSSGGTNGGGGNVGGGAATGTYDLGLEYENGSEGLYQSEPVVGWGIPDTAVIASVKNPTFNVYSLAHGGAPYIILNPEQSTGFFDGQALKQGWWSAQLAGDLTTLPFQLLVQVSWKA